jgi:hypothetical protein
MNIKLLKEAIAIIECVPDYRIDLGSWQSNEGADLIKALDQIECGTIACAAGYLALHPKMQALGLSPGYHGAPSFKGLFQFEALSEFFDLSPLKTRYLFGDRSPQEKNDDQMLGTGFTDRVLWLTRARKIIADHESRFAEIILV